MRVSYIPLEEIPWWFFALWVSLLLTFVWLVIRSVRKL